MKEIFKHSYGKRDFTIYKKGELFYLKLGNTTKIRTDNINIAKSYIDGYIDALKEEQPK